MNIELHINELVLDGFGHLDRAEVGMVVQQELGRLLAEQGVPAAWRQGGEVANLAGGRFEAAPAATARQVGVGVAQAIYGGKHP